MADLEPYVPGPAIRSQLRMPRLLPGGTLSLAKPLGVGLNRGHRRPLGALVLHLAPPAGRAWLLLMCYIHI
jgi:hypothetical protein